jgi:hypothetical protein
MNNQLKLYDQFRVRQLMAGMPMDEIISFQTFNNHTKRAMEYAEFCEEQAIKLGLKFINDCGGMTCSYRQFDISQCREFAISGK